ncbi:hypothetical protein L1887_48630 [Cichorium endivia]|nr:hypothetical protein L1887_48630 [Cichorium endivia]
MDAGSLPTTILPSSSSGGKPISTSTITRTATRQPMPHLENLDGIEVDVEAYADSLIAPALEPSLVLDDDQDLASQKMRAWRATRTMLAACERGVPASIPLPTLAVDDLVRLALAHLKAPRAPKNGISNQQSAISNQQSAISNQQSAISNQQHVQHQDKLALASDRAMRSTCITEIARCRDGPGCHVTAGVQTPGHAK